MAGKPIRLGKAAGELNVGISTLVDFLDSKGVKIDGNPNFKLEAEHYDLLRHEFAADHDLKEQSKQTSVKRERRETISLKDTRENDDVLVVENQKTQPEKSQEPVEIPKVEEASEDSGSDSDSKTVGDGDVKVQIVGKIDLDSINSKTRPDKKKKGEESPKRKNEAEPAKQPDKKEEVEANTVKEEKKTTTEEKPAQEDIETIRVQSQTISAPKVLGKIELPVEKPKTSGQGSHAGDRKKRKRIKKIDVNKQAQQQNSGQNKGGNYKKGGGSKTEKPEISEQDIQKEIKETLARLSNKGSKSKGSKNRRAKRDNFAQRRQEEELAAELESKILKLTEFVTVSELATMMNVQATQVIAACMSLGIFASINQRLDAETI